MRLREERERLGLSQTEAAEMAANAGVAGATRQSQALYEKGKRMPDAAYLSVIQAAGYDVLYILTGQRQGSVVPSPAPALTREEECFLDNWRNCPQDAKQRITEASALFSQLKKKRA